MPPINNSETWIRSITRRSCHLPCSIWSISFLEFVALRVEKKNFSLYLAGWSASLSQPSLDFRVTGTSCAAEVTEEVQAVFQSLTHPPQSRPCFHCEANNPSCLQRTPHQASCPCNYFLDSSELLAWLLRQSVSWEGYVVWIFHGSSAESLYDPHVAEIVLHKLTFPEPRRLLF